MELGVAGVRLDAAKHMPSEDLLKIFKKVKLAFFEVFLCLIWSTLFLCFV